VEEARCQFRSRRDSTVESRFQSLKRTKKQMRHIRVMGFTIVIRIIEGRIVRYWPRSHSGREERATGAGPKIRPVPTPINGHQRTLNYVIRGLISIVAATTCPSQFQEIDRRSALNTSSKFSTISRSGRRSCRQVVGRTEWPGTPRKPNTSRMIPSASADSCS